MTKEEIEELKGLAASMGLYDDKNPCKRAVILGKAIKALEQEPCEDATLKDIFCMGCEYKEQEPKTGHWIRKSAKYSRYEYVYVCSECGNNNGFHKANYCPRCGAEMAESEVRK